MSQPVFLTGGSVGPRGLPGRTDTIRRCHCSHPVLNRKTHAVRSVNPITFVVAGIRMRLGRLPIFLVWAAGCLGTLNGPV